MQYIRKNEYNSFTFTLTNCDGSALDLSEATVKFIVKKSSSDADGLALLSSEVENPETNVIMFEFDATQTASLNEGTCVMAIKKYTDDDKNTELWSDDAKVIKGVFSA